MRGQGTAEGGSNVRNSARRCLPLLAAGLILAAGLASGCLRDQMARREAPGTRTPEQVRDAALAVLRERYYEVKEFPKHHWEGSAHLVALTPIRAQGTQNLRKKVDVWIFQENGFWMPKVFVRQYVDIADPPEETHTTTGGPGADHPIVGRWPIDQMGYPSVKEDWHPLYYDRNEEESIRVDILKRLNIPL
jgi:hypothetical protein